MKTYLNNLEMWTDERRLLGSVISGFCPEHIAAPALLAAFGETEDARESMRRFLVSAILRAIWLSGSRQGLAEAEAILRERISTETDSRVIAATLFSIAVLEEIRVVVQTWDVSLDDVTTRQSAKTAVWKAATEACR